MTRRPPKTQTKSDLESAITAAIASTFPGLYSAPISHQVEFTIPLGHAKITASWSRELDQARPDQHPHLSRQAAARRAAAARAEARRSPDLGRGPSYLLCAAHGFVRLQDSLRLVMSMRQAGVRAER